MLSFGTLISNKSLWTISPKHNHILSTTENARVAIAFAVFGLATSTDTPIFKLHLGLMKNWHVDIMHTMDTTRDVTAAAMCEMYN
jgi:hypothetical protein